jgi:uncharacterized UBP type Zn finger protein
MGNDCFANSVVQCILALPLMRDSVRQLAPHYRNNPVLQQLDRIAKAKNETHVGALRTAVNANFAHGQQDVSEFFLYLINQLPRPIKELFAFRITDHITCLSCGHVSCAKSQIVLFSKEKENNQRMSMIICSHWCGLKQQRE